MIENFTDGGAMTIPRSQQISLEHTQYYHCTSRCVRRAFLCGRDSYFGKNFEHRKTWLERRLTTLANVFAIDLMAYAIMSNHYHVVVHINVSQAARWSKAEVAERWGKVFALPDAVTTTHIALWRARLASLSWYMRCINEPLAHHANREDDCSGCFWEGRFRCQALLDHVAVLKCMAYVDLNPIRACVAATPETSAHTSIMARVKGLDTHLMAFDNRTDTESSSIPFKFDDYLSLLDWTGRSIRHGKRGNIPAQLPNILSRLNIPGAQWMVEITHYGQWCCRAVGPLIALEAYCYHLGQQWLKGASTFATQPP